MRMILAPLITTGQDGVEAVCADGVVQHVHPVVAAYIADHPEQCLVTGCQENFCPKCTVHSFALGEPVYLTMKKPGPVVEAIDRAARGEKPAEFQDLSLRLIDPFWHELPHCDIFSCITPNLLHQLHKGVFKDHTISWVTKSLDGGGNEIDQRFKMLPGHPALRHFKKGIALISQWTGTEYKHMEHVFLGVMTGASDPMAVRAVRAVLDFIYYAHFEAHSDDSLLALETTWVMFHENKDIFHKAGIHNHFHIPKLHSALHYTLSIRKLGTADGFNTENTEHLHIDYAKRGYNTSNKKEYIKQMTVWPGRQEAVSRSKLYLAWASPPTTTSLGPGCGDDGDVLMDENISALPVDENISALPVDGYKITKTPGMPGTSVRMLVCDFGCTDFISALKTFLRNTVTKSCTASRVEACHALTMHSPHAQDIHSGTQFVAYKHIEVSLPPMRQVSCHPIKDVIRAVPSQPARGLMKASPVHFDTY